MSTETGQVEDILEPRAGDDLGDAQRNLEAVAGVTARQRRPQHRKGVPKPRMSWVAPALVACVTFVVFSPVLRNGFVNWDDHLNFLQNPFYRGLGREELRWMWTTFHMNSYRPLTWMTYGADYLLWGLTPAGYHLTSLLLHVVNAVLVYWLVRRLLSLARPGTPAGERGHMTVVAAVTAVLFALHPLRVEPVAWASARADLLASLFLLLSAIAYLRSRGGSLSAFALYWLSLQGKPVGVTFPAVLLILDVYPLRRLGGGSGGWLGPAVRGVWLEKLVFLAPAIATMHMAWLSKSTETDLGKPSGPMAYLAGLAFGFAFPVWKTFVPVRLSPLYERPFHLNPLAWPFLLSAALVVSITGLVILARRRWPAALAAWGCSLALLAPTSGIIPFGRQLAADRFAYLGSVGWTLVTVVGLCWAWRRWAGERLSALHSFGIVSLALVAIAWLGLLTSHQVRAWRDSETLWAHALSIDPDSAIAHNNLGQALLWKGEVARAAEHFRRALELRPTFETARSNLDSALRQMGE